MARWWPRCTASTSPACTLVMAWGALMRLEDRPGHPGGDQRQALGGRQIGGPVPRRPLPLPLLQEGHLLGKGVVVERGLDLEDLEPAGGDQPAHAPVGRVQLGALLVHERAAVPHGAHVVVVAQAAVAGQAGGDALVAAVHGHQVDVDVDEQVGLGRPPVDLHLLALVGLAEIDQAVGILGVVLQEQAVRGEGVVDPVADGVAQLGLGHAPVQGQGADQHHVVDAGGGGQVEHRLDDPLAVVGPVHRRQRQGDVVEGDGEPHARRRAAPAAACSRRGDGAGPRGRRRRGRRAGRAAPGRR